MKVTIPYRLIDHELYMGLCVASPLLILRDAVFSDEIVRIGVVREHQHLDLKVFCQKSFDRPLRCLHTRSITIIVHHNLTRKAANQFHLLRRQRGAETRR